MANLLTLDGQAFAIGCSTFLDSNGAAEPTPKIFVKILPADIPVPLLAQLDTGAAWSVLDVEIADALGFLDQAGPSVSMSTRSGTIPGKLIRAPLTIVADEGESYELDATVFVSREWTYGNFLGYSGFLERIRFAIDPSANRFYFGGIPGMKVRFVPRPRTEASRELPRQAQRVPFCNIPWLPRPTMAMSSTSNFA